jgi:SET domain-containing protein
MKLQSSTVHNDLMGPFPHSSISKARYVLTFIDDYSHYTWVYFLRQKFEVFEHLKDFKALVKTQTGKKTKILRTDNGGVYQQKCSKYLS